MGKKTKPFAELAERQLRAEAEKLVRSGRMPSIDELAQAVLISRKAYRLKILRARREAREKKVAVIN